MDEEISGPSILKTLRCIYKAVLFEKFQPDKGSKCELKTVD